MADKSFGVEQLDIFGTGTPTIQSPTDLNLNANTVAISTNFSVGGTATLGTVSIASGIVTASSGVVTYYGDGQYLTGVSGGGGGSLGVASATSLTIDDYIYHSGDTNTFIGFESNDTIRFNTNGSDKFKINSSGHLILKDDNDTYIHHPADDVLAFTIGSTERLRVNSSGITVTGIVTANTFDGATSSWVVGNNGASNYTFTGPGGLSNSSNSTLYLARGQTYIFDMNASGHGFGIQTSSGTWNASNEYTTAVSYTHLTLPTSG